MNLTKWISTILVASVVLSGTAMGATVTGFAAMQSTATSPTTDVVLQPENTTVAVGESVDYQIVLTNATGGVGAFDNVTVSVNDSDVASITNISTSVSASANSGVATDGSSAYVNVPFGGDTADSGEVVIATVTVKKEAAGTAALNLNVTQNIATESGQLYTISSVGDATITSPDLNQALMLNPEAQTIPRNSSTTFEVVLENVTSGVGAFDNITVAVNDSATAQITNISTSVSASATAGVAADGGSAYVNVPFGGDTADTGDVTVATVTVAGQQVGTAAIEINATGDVADESGSLYSLDAVRGGTMTVAEPPKDMTGNGKSPQNADDDSQLEDVNGESGMDIGDVQALYNNRKLDAEVLRTHPEFFDFNGNGQIDLGDIQALFTEYLNQG